MEDYWGGKETRGGQKGKASEDANGAVRAGGDDGDGDVEMGIE